MLSPESLSLGQEPRQPLQLPIPAQEQMAAANLMHTGGISSEAEPTIEQNTEYSTRVNPAVVAVRGIANAVSAFSERLKTRGKIAQASEKEVYSTRNAEKHSQREAAEAYKRAKFGTGETDIKYSPGWFDREVSHQAVPGKKKPEEKPEETRERINDWLEAPSLSLNKDEILDGKIITLQSRIQELERLPESTKVGKELRQLKEEASMLHSIRAERYKFPEYIEKTPNEKRTSELDDLQKRIKGLEELPQNPITQYELKRLKIDENRLKSLSETMTNLQKRIKGLEELPQNPKIEKQLKTLYQQEFQLYIRVNGRLPGATISLSTDKPEKYKPQGRIVPSLRHSMDREQKARQNTREHLKQVEDHYYTKEKLSEERSANLKKNRKLGKVERQKDQWERQQSTPEQEVFETGTYFNQRLAEEAKRLDESQE